MKYSRITVSVCVFIVVVAALVNTGAVEARSIFLCGKSNCLVSGPQSSPKILGGLNSLSILSATDIWGVGNTFTKLGYPRTLTEHWNGSVWSRVASPNVLKGMNGDELSSVAAVSPQDIWAVGYSSAAYDQALVEHWNGTQWSIVVAPDPAQEVRLFGVTAISANDVWAVGNYASQSDSGSLIEHWDGSSWSVVPNPAKGVLLSISAHTATDIWAAGFFFGTLIEHWDGKQWSIVSSPNPGIDNFINGITAHSSTDVWAVGYSYDGQTTTTLTEHWDGTSWSVVKSPNPAKYSDVLFGVTIVSANDVWAVGDMAANHTSDYALIEHWNGTSWSVVKSPQIAGGLFAIAQVSANDIWAVGDTDSSYVLIEYWDGKQWSRV